MRLLVVVAALVVLTGCGLSPFGGVDQGDIDEAGARTCAEVRAGIDAFNEQDYTGTIDRFERAVPLAERYAEVSDETLADELLEAVEYYAELPAEEYREAFESSPEFKKYQAITLGQCEQGPASEDEGTPT